jgi:hypothetical protein
MLRVLCVMLRVLPSRGPYAANSPLEEAPLAVVSLSTREVLPLLEARPSWLLYSTWSSVVIAWLAASRASRLDSLSGCDQGVQWLHLCC